MSDHERVAAAIRAWRRSGGPLLIAVNGRSMEPLLRPGDLIAIEPAQLPSLKPGAIVVVQDGAGLLTHRLIRAEGATLLLWGDGLPGPDPPLAAAGLVGVAIARERSGRRLQLTGRLWSSLGSMLIHPSWRPLARLGLAALASMMRGDGHP